MYFKMSKYNLIIYFSIFVHYCPGLCQDFGYDGKVVIVFNEPKEPTSQDKALIGNSGQNLGTLEPTKGSKIRPGHWGEKYRSCMGKHQSPIDIEEDKVKIVKLPPLKFKNFDKKLEEVKILNNGHTVALSIHKGEVPQIYGGPLKAKYKFVQLHFHWGMNDREGSENLINNHSFPMELHMVFYDENYDDFIHASNYSDGLTVLSFLYHASGNSNTNYEQFENELPKVHNSTSSVTLRNFVSLNKFTVNDRKTYFTYKGSLTTPPCSEVVTWIEFKNTIPLSHEQIKTFRMLSGESGQLIHNFRPIQPLYDRIILMNSSSNSCIGLNKFIISIAILSFVHFHIKI